MAMLPIQNPSLDLCNLTLVRDTFGFNADDYIFDAADFK